MGPFGDTMKITVENHRGIARAELELAPIALVAGPNGAGKSSIAQAVAAAVMQNAAVLPGFTKGTANRLLRDGAEKGQCVVEHNAARALVRWPAASHKADEMAPSGSAIACGLESLATMPKNQAAQLLITLTKAVPTLEDLKARLEWLPGKTLDGLWAMIQEKGWQNAHTSAKEKGAMLKGAWQQVTGENWGDKKAVDWVPRLLDGVDQASMLAKLQGRAEAAQQAMNDAIAGQGADQASIALLQEQVAAGEGAEQQLADLRAQHDELLAQHAELDLALADLPRPAAQQAVVACPHCEGKLVVQSRTVLLKAGQQQSPEEVKAMQFAVADLEGKMAGISNQANDLAAGMRAANDRQQRAAGAAQRLTTIKAGSVTQEDLRRCQEELRGAQAELANFEKAISAVDEAEAHYRNIQTNKAIQEVLAPDGLRLEVMERKIGDFNAILEEHSTHAGFAPVTVDRDLNTYLGGREYLLLSESERFRVRLALQLAIAEIDGSSLVVIDAADILDRTGRNGLFKVLRRQHLPALVCMTIDARENVPDLAKAKAGRSYWIKDAVAEAL